MSRARESSTTETPVSAAWQLGQYRQSGSDRPEVGILLGDSVLRAPEWLPGSVAKILDRWDDFRGPLAALRTSELETIEAVTLCAPILYPRKVICAGANFGSHIAEMGAAHPAPGTPPFFFLKPPTTTVVGPGTTCPLPSGAGPQYDWEAELGIVIGRHAKGIRADEARSVIAGYTIADDLSARGRFTRAGSTAPFDWDWLGQKNQDASCPIGPGIVPAWLVPQIDTSRIRLSVNGEIMQDESLSDLIVGIDGLVAAASAAMTLEPGDIILAGTPAGVGLPQNRFLQAGDTVEVSIEGLGTLRHGIGPATPGPWLKRP